MYAQQLISDYDIIFNNWNEFISLWEKFWTGDSSVLGDLLTCHLILEFHLTNWIVVANPGMSSKGTMRLSFIQKIELANGVDESIQILIPGMKCVNKIRNKFAHDIFANLENTDLKLLQDFVWPWHKAVGKPQNKGIQLVKDFTLMASGLLYGQAKAIEKYAKGDGIVVYRRWINNAISKDEKNAPNK